MRLSQLILLQNGSLVQYHIEKTDAGKRRVSRIKCIDHEYFIICDGRASGATMLRMLNWMDDSAKFRKHLADKVIYTEPRSVNFHCICLN